MSTVFNHLTFIAPTADKRVPISGSSTDSVLTEAKEKYERQLASLILKARAFFVSEKEAKTLCDNVKIFESSVEGRVIRIFGVKREDQNKLDYPIVKNNLLSFRRFRMGR